MCNGDKSRYALRQGAKEEKDMKNYGSKDQESRITTPAAVRQRKCPGGGCAVAGPHHKSLTTVQRMINDRTSQPLQRVATLDEEEGMSQLKKNTTGTQAAVTQRVSMPDEEELTQRKKNTTGMPDTVKQRAEETLNADFSNVRIHANSAKAPAVGALAYTQGSDIHFAPGSYSPNSNSGRSLLGHELTHVVQQAQGRVQPTTSVAGVPVNDNPSLEQEADRLGGKI